MGNTHTHTNTHTQTHTHKHTHTHTHTHAHAHTHTHTHTRTRTHARHAKSTMRDCDLESSVRLAETIVPCDKLISADRQARYATRCRMHLTEHTIHLQVTLKARALANALVAIDRTPVTRLYRRTTLSAPPQPGPAVRWDRKLKRVAHKR